MIRHILAEPKTIILLRRLAMVMVAGSMQMEHLAIADYAVTPQFLPMTNWSVAGRAYVVISTTANCYYRCTNCGTPVIQGNSVYVNQEWWLWTGGFCNTDPRPPRLIQYDLGLLSPGNYLFTHYVWNSPVASIQF